MKKDLCIFLSFFLTLFLIPTSSYAYIENYPPYKFKDGPPSHINAELLVDLKKPEYKSQDGAILARLDEDADKSEILLKEGDVILAQKKLKKHEDTDPLPHAIYFADVDSNGLKDFIIFYSYRYATGYVDRVELFLRKQDGSYQKIFYDTLSSDIKDFINLKNNSRPGVIITGSAWIGEHRYFTYNAYKINDYKLVNADSEIKGFPKLIWNTDKPNDKDTQHLTGIQKAEITKEKNASIKYGNE